MWDPVAILKMVTYAGVYLTMIQIDYDFIELHKQMFSSWLLWMDNFSHMVWQVKYADQSILLIPSTVELRSYDLSQLNVHPAADLTIQ